MKLFIWQGNGVLTDWTSGQIIVLAPSLEDALATIEAEQSYAMGNFPPMPTETIDLINVENVSNRAWITWGGG